MKIDVVEKDGYFTAALQGAIDETCKSPFDELLHPVVERGGGRLLIDLSGSQRINSAGITHLVKLITRANTKGSRVILAGATPFVSSVFSMSKLDKFFEIVESMSEAEDRLAAR